MRRRIEDTRQSGDDFAAERGSLLFTRPFQFATVFAAARAASAWNPRDFRRANPKRHLAAMEVSSFPVSRGLVASRVQVHCEFLGEGATIALARAGKIERGTESLLPTTSLWSLLDFSI